jgi:hypothetical protein
VVLERNFQQNLVAVVLAEVVQLATAAGAMAEVPIMLVAMQAQPEVAAVGEPEVVMVAAAQVVLVAKPST